MRQKGERVHVLADGRKVGGGILIQTESVYIIRSNEYNFSFFAILYDILGWK